MATGIISTIAGTGSTGYNGDGRDATSASLYNPTFVALDTSSNVYIADNNNHRIRKIDTDTGFILTFAGTGTSSFTGDGGSATIATLNQPVGIALDSSGNVYIADSNNYRVRKVAFGLISTIAGSTSSSFSGDGGPATSAGIAKPFAVALDTSGNIYIADSYDTRVRKVTVATGIISTIAGGASGAYNGDNIQATAAGLNGPSGVFVDSGGNIYISDTSNNRIRKVTAATGIITTFAGSGTGSFGGDGGAATSGSIYYPVGIAIDSSGSRYSSLLI